MKQNSFLNLANNLTIESFLLNFEYTYNAKNAAETENSTPKIKNNLIFSKNTTKDFVTDLNKQFYDQHISKDINKSYEIFQSVFDKHKKSLDNKEKNVDEVQQNLDMYRSSLEYNKKRLEELKKERDSQDPFLKANLSLFPEQAKKILEIDEAINRTQQKIHDYPDQIKLFEKKLKHSQESLEQERTNNIVYNMQQNASNLAKEIINFDTKTSDEKKALLDKIKNTDILTLTTLIDGKENLLKIAIGQKQSEVVKTLLDRSKETDMTRFPNSDINAANSYLKKHQIRQIMDVNTQQATHIPFQKKSQQSTSLSK